MDSGDLERERGITILAKNTAIQYGDVKINIVDTPGHADFGGEVERILKMVNGVILLVDAAEGPMPQTRFVLSKCPGAGPPGHRGRQQDRPPRPAHPRGHGRGAGAAAGPGRHRGAAGLPHALLLRPPGHLPPRTPTCWATDLQPLFETILNYIPAPEADADKPFQMLVSSIDYNEFVGRIAIGRIERGTIKQNQEITVCNYHDPGQQPARPRPSASTSSTVWPGRRCTEAAAGNIIAMSGIGDITIGDTICAPEPVEPLPFVKISAPTIEMTFSVNDSPFAGREGKYVTSRQPAGPAACGRP